MPTIDEAVDGAFRDILQGKHPYRCASCKAPMVGCTCPPPGCGGGGVCKCGGLIESYTPASYTSQE